MIRRSFAFAIRRVECRAIAQPFRRAIGFTVAIAACSLLASFESALARQVDDETTAVASDDVDPLGAFGSRPIQFIARVAAEGAQLRSGPGRTYPVVEDVTPGMLLPVVGENDVYLEVFVPSGFHVFIKRDYVEPGSDGIGMVRGASVNLRSRPTLEGDYPVGQLPSGTEVWIVGTAGEDDSWYEIVAPLELTLWIPESSIEIGDDTTAPTTRAALLEALDARRREWVENSPEARVAATQRAHEAELEGDLRLANEEIRRQRERGADADYTPARAMLSRIVTDTGSSTLREAAQAQLDDLDADERRAAREREMREQAERLKQELEAEKQRLADANRKAAEESAKYSVGPKRAIGDSETVTGFLRARGDGTTFAIERGNSIAVLLKSSDQRYRLADFVGRQVEVKGRYVVGGNPPTLEVTRLMIFRR